MRKHIIPTPTVEAFYDRVRAQNALGEVAENPDSWPGTLLDDYGALMRGEALLEDAAGVRWAEVDAEDPRVGRELMEHRILRHEDVLYGQPHAVLNATTLDLHRAYCLDCYKWVDMVAEKAEADRLEAAGELAPWEE